MAKRYLKIMVSRLNTSNPNIHVSPSNGRRITEPFRATLTFFNLQPAAALFDTALRPSGVPGHVWLILLADTALRKAKMKMNELI